MLAGIVRVYFKNIKKIIIFFFGFKYSREILAHKFIKPIKDFSIKRFLTR